ncbi:hypothetical protein ACFSHR_19245 [Azotobacter chroococcum]
MNHPHTSATSSLATADRVARGLGYFSLGLGLLELASPRLVTRSWAWRAPRHWCAPPAPANSSPGSARWG